VADVEAVIFDWGGTLTPWRTVDYREEWRCVAALVDGADEDLLTERLLQAAAGVWARSRDEHRSATFEEVCLLAGITPGEAHTAAYRAFWEPSTRTDPDVEPLWRALGDDGILVGVLSNTIWPRAWHEEIFARDGVLDLIAGDVYSCEIPHTKPHPDAFGAAMAAVGVDDPARCVYVGDRLFDDIWGAGNAGMRSIWVPHSDIPTDQHGHSEGEPDAVTHRLAEVHDIVRAWAGS